MKPPTPPTTLEAQSVSESGRVHFSVMLPETLEFLQVRSGGVYFDGTFGEGGHTDAILDAGGNVCASDRDTQAIEVYRARGKHRNHPGLSLEHVRFSEIASRWPETLFDGAIVDLGVSTKQILSVERGFSFQGQGPLDMRMDSTDPSDLADLLERLSVEKLAEGLERSTDLPNALPVARVLKKAFENGELSTTDDLKRLYRPRRGAGAKSNPATALFLALRRLVNEETQETELGLPAVLERLKPGARLVVLTFHSTEDREVKKLFQRLAGRCVCELAICLCPKVARVRLLTTKPVDPSAEELKLNPRSRSAKLRCVEKLPSP